jgi:hypothetical protein
MAAHPGLTLIALVLAMPVASISVSSTVEVAAVGRSRLGLDSAAGVLVSVTSSVLALAAVAFLLYVVFCAGDWGDDDDGRGGGDEPPAPEGPSGEPDWWPLFEQEFATHLREQERSVSESQTPATIAGSSAP